MLSASRNAFLFSVSVFAFTNLLIFAFLATYLSLSIKTEKEIIQKESENFSQIVQKTFFSGIDDKISSAQFLAQSLKVSSADSDEMHTFSSQTRLLGEYIENSDDIDQVRLINLQGQEIIRFNRADGASIQVPESQLQNKSDRYYFLDALELHLGQVALSRIDLNVENGRVEIPFKPTLRISLPVFDTTGDRKGVLVVNFLAKKFIEKLKKLSSTEDQRVWLMDDRFDWIVAPKNQQSWATQLKLQGNNLSQYLPELKKAVDVSDTEIFSYTNETQFYQVVKLNLINEYQTPKFESVTSRYNQYYIVVAQDLPANWIEQIFGGGTFSRLAYTLFGVGTLFSVLIGMIAFRRNLLKRELEFQKEMMAQFFNHAPDGMLIFNKEGKSIFVNEFMSSFIKSATNSHESSKVPLLSSGQRKVFFDEFMDRGKKYQSSEISLLIEEHKRYFAQQVFIITSEIIGDVYLGVLFTEVTELRESQQNLINSEAKVRQLLDAAPDAILLSNKAGNILLSNRKAQEMFEISKEALEDLNIDALVPHPYKTGHKGMRHSYFEKPKMATMSERPDIQAQSVCGRTFYAEISLSPIKQDDDYQVISIVRDITERKRFENHMRQSQKMESLGQLTGGIAHDFNNLLTTMIGNLDLAKLWAEKQESENVVNLNNRLDTALNAALKAAKLTRRLLAFSRKQPLAANVLYLGKLIEDELNIFKSASGKLVDFHFNTEPDIWPAKLDPEEFTNAIINLITNAKDAMPEGGEIFVSVENYSVKENSMEMLGIEVPVGDYISVAVSDTGSGIPKEMQDKVFEPFFTTKPKYQGTGLGLSQVFGFIKQSAGYIKVYSEVNLGTTIKLFFPKYMAEITELHEDSKAMEKIHSYKAEEDQAEVKKEHLDIISDKTRKTILVVDDEPDLRMLATEYLKAEFETVLTASNSVEAMAVLEENDVDLVVSDVIMPGKNGFEMAKDINERYPEIKIIFSSGFPENAVQHVNTLDDGIRILDKPYRKHEMIKFIYDTLNED